MTAARWIILDNAGAPIAAVGGPLSTGRALRILKDRRKRGIASDVRLIQVDVAIQPVGLDWAIGFLDRWPVGG